MPESIAWCWREQSVGVCAPTRHQVVLAEDGRLPLKSQLHEQCDHQKVAIIHVHWLTASRRLTRVQKESINHSGLGTSQWVCLMAEHVCPTPSDEYAEHTTSLAHNGSACTPSYPYYKCCLYMLHAIASALQKGNWAFTC